MPIQADSNIPTVAGYKQVVSFHLLSREGEKIDLEGATYTVDNITELDALLSVKASEINTPETPPEPGEEEKVPKLADAIVLIKHEQTKTNPKIYQKWTEFTIDAVSFAVTVREKPSNSETWQSFAYKAALNPTSSFPCHSGLEFNRHMSFVDSVVPEGEYGLGDIKPSIKIELDDASDTDLLSKDTAISIPGTISVVENNTSSCTLGDPIFTDFDIKGWKFNPADYPKTSPSAPNPKVKLLWISGYKES
jgi:hypothetical protein